MKGLPEVSPIPQTDIPEVAHLLEQLFVHRRNTYAIQKASEDYLRVEKPLSAETIENHLMGKMTAGVYQVDPTNDTVVWLCFDFDLSQGGDLNELKSKVTVVRQNLLDVGISERSMVLEWSGRRGYHSWTFFQLPVPTEFARNFGLKVLADSKQEGVELFPKQREVSTDRFGNLLKLPLGLHRVSGKWSYFVKPYTYEKLPWQILKWIRPWRVPDDLIKKFTGTGTRLQKPRAKVRKKIYAGTHAPCIKLMLEGTVEGHRNDHGIRIASYFSNVKRWGKQAVLDELARWNERNQPPLDERKLHELVQTAEKGGYAWSCDDEVLKEFCKPSPSCPLCKPRLRGQKAKPGELGAIEGGKVTEGGEEGDITDRAIGYAMAHTVELFHDDRGDAFARIDVGGHHEIHAVQSRGFANWIRQQYFEKEGEGLKGEPLRDALANIEARAQFGKDSQEKQLYNRVGFSDGSIFYDLADPKWRAVKVSPEGWGIVEHPPTLFRRFRHQKLQSDPELGGSIDELFDFLNVKNEEDRLLLKCYVVVALVPGIPHPILLSVGPQGCGKSTCMRILRALIDPSRIPLLSFNYDREETALLHHQHYAPYFDNISGVPSWLSDILSRACTGDGFTKRKLYTDEDAVVLEFMRCVGLNGIAVAPSKPDLLDRTITITLDQIPEGGHKREREIIREFEKARPRLFGAMVDTLSKAMRIVNEIKIEELPRMADFAAWGEAVARVLGYKEGEFLAAYKKKRGEQGIMVLEQHPIALAVLEFMKNRNFWKGKPIELLEELTKVASEHRIDTKEERWPAAASWLTRRIREVQAELERQGVGVQSGHTGRQRIFTLFKGGSLEAYLGKGGDGGDGANDNNGTNGISRMTSGGDYQDERFPRKEGYTEHENQKEGQKEVVQEGGSTNAREKQTPFNGENAVTAVMPLAEGVRGWVAFEFTKPLEHEIPYWDPKNLKEKIMFGPFAEKAIVGLPLITARGLEREGYGRVLQ